MRTSTRTFGFPELLIVVGSFAFVFILGLSAYFEADIRWLHFFQAWMYLGTIVLVLRGNRWGHFIGISAAGFWDYINLFVTTFFSNGLHWLRASVSAGQIQHVDQIIAVPAWIGNLLVLVGCIWAYGRLPEKKFHDLARFVLAVILTTGFFAGDIAIFQPRFLPLFRRSLHPHSPFAAMQQLDLSAAITRIANDKYLTAPDHPAARQKIRDLLTASPQDFMHEDRAREGPSSVPRLRDIHVPVLIVFGDADIPDVHAHAGVIEVGIPNARRVVVPDTGHLMYLEKPEEFARIAIHFLESSRIKP